MSRSDRARSAALVPKVTIREALRMKQMYLPVEKGGEGLPRDEVARRVGRSPSTVSLALRRVGVQMRGVGGPHKALYRLSREEIDRTVDLHAAGRSHQEIAAEVGCHPSTVSRRLARAGVTARSRSEAQLVRWRGPEALRASERCARTVPAPPIARLVARTVGKDGELALARRSGVSDKLLRRLRQGAEYVEWTTADKILTALDALWIDAYCPVEDPDAYREAAAVWEAA